MLRPQKDATVATLGEVLGGAAGAVFVDYTGLTVAESDGFRRSLRGTGLRFRVVKNSLVARALAGAGQGDAAAMLAGSPTGLVWGADDPVAVAKATLAFGASCEHLRVKGGVVESRAVSAEETVALSKMANKAQTQAAVAALARGPERQVCGALQAAGARVAGAVAALVARLEPEAGA